MLPFCENKKVSSDSDSVHTALTREVSVLQLGSGGLRDGRLAFGGMAFAEKSHVCDHTHVLETKTGWQSTLLVALSSSLRSCTYTPTLAGYARPRCGAGPCSHHHHSLRWASQPRPRPRPAQRFLPSLRPDRLWSAPALVCAGFSPNPFCSSPFIL